MQAVACSFCQSAAPSSARTLRRCEPFRTAPAHVRCVQLACACDVQLSVYHFVITIFHLALQTVRRATPLEGPGTEVLGRFCDLARRLGIWLSLGGFQETSPDPGRLYNTHVVLDGGGGIVARYRKIHLFDVDVRYGPILVESRSTMPGSEVGSFLDFWLHAYDVCLWLRGACSQLLSSIWFDCLHTEAQDCPSRLWTVRRRPATWAS